jgi:hypothetical protein
VIRQATPDSGTPLAHVDDGGLELPAGCTPEALALAVEVRRFALADVLALVHAAGADGVLAFARDARRQTVFFHRGEVVFASSNQRVDRLGECLVRAGMLRFEDLREAERAHAPGARFGKVLVERGLLSPRELWRGVRYQVEEIVRSLVAQPAGRAYFYEGHIPPDNVVRLALPTRRLVAEGIQRRAELRKLLAHLEDPRVRLMPIGDGSSLLGEERALFDAIGQRASFAELRQRLGSEPLGTARVLQLLRLAGAVKIVRLHEDGRYLGESDLRLLDQDALRRSVDLHLKIIATLAETIAGADGPAALRERLSGALADAASAHPELLGGLLLGPHGSLDGEEIVARALRMRRDRVQEVNAALGELVAYLEFEIRNHPGLDDPERALAEIKPLHAALDG